jgi:hypothetical protein
MIAVGERIVFKYVNFFIIFSTSFPPLLGGLSRTGAGLNYPMFIYFKYILIIEILNEREINIMKNTPVLDYSSQYDLFLATEHNIEKLKASDFLNLFSDLILKYETSITEKLIGKSEGE